MRPSPIALIAFQTATMGLLGSARLVSAADLSAECPASIPAESFAPGRPPPGWTGVIRGPLHLNGAGMMAGPPAEYQYLVPTKEGPTQQVYEFQGGDRKRWLWCAYDGAAQLSRRLDNKATLCTITEKRRGKQLVGAAVRCR